MRMLQLLRAALAGVLLSLGAAAAISASPAASAAAAPPAKPAQEPASAPGAENSADAQAPRPPEATLRVFNRQIVTMRGMLFGLTPADRVRRAEQRIAEQIDRPGAQVVDAQPIPQGLAVRIDGVLAFMLTADDVDPLEPETLQGTADAAVQALGAALAQSRDGRNVRVIAMAALLSAAATLALAAWIWLLGRLRQRVTDAVLALGQREAGRLAAGGVAALLQERLAAVVPIAVRVLYALLLLLGLYQWLSMVLAQFPYTRPWGEHLNSFLVDQVSGIVRGVVAALPDLFTALTIFLLAYLSVHMVGRFFDAVHDGRIVLGWLEADLARPTRRLASLAVWLFAIAMAYPYLPGSDTQAFQGLSVLVGLMVSLGASSLVGQAASGLILTYSRIIRRGEYVRIADNEGTVTEIGVFGTRVRTGMGEELTLPNALILSNVTRNYSRAVKGVGYVVDTTVTIGYDTPWRQVHAMLVEAARRTPGVLADPAPRVMQTALSDFYPEYRLVCQAVPSSPRPRADVLNALHANIQDVFNEHGVQIMSPHYLGDPADAKLVPRDRWFTPPAKPPAE